MNKQTIIGIIIGLVIGAIGTVGVTTATKNSGTSKTTIITRSASTTNHNAQATANLKNLKNDEFDKAFITEMVSHHQGAIDMAKLINTNGKHAELKTLGQDIISAQTKEIDMMQAWQMEWGYKNSDQSMPGMDHSAH